VKSIKEDFIINLSPSITVKEFRKAANNGRSYGQKYKGILLIHIANCLFLHHHVSLGMGKNISTNLFCNVKRLLSVDDENFSIVFQRT